MSRVVNAGLREAKNGQKVSTWFMDCPSGHISIALFFFYKTRNQSFQIKFVS